MSHVNRGLPLSNSRTEQIFPTLTPAQIRRIATHGRMRVLRPGEVLVEQGDNAVPFFAKAKDDVRGDFLVIFDEEDETHLSGRYQPSSASR